MITWELSPTRFRDGEAEAQNGETSAQISPPRGMGTAWEWASHIPLSCVHQLGMMPSSDLPAAETHIQDQTESNLQGEP